LSGIKPKDPDYASSSGDPAIRHEITEDCRDPSIFVQCRIFGLPRSMQCEGLVGIWSVYPKLFGSRRSSSGGFISAVRDPSSWFPEILLAHDVEPTPHPRPESPTVIMSHDEDLSYQRVGAGLFDAVRRALVIEEERLRRWPDHTVGDGY